MVRYRQLGYVALNVTDLQRSRRFYEEVVGLQPNGVGPDGAVYFRFGTAHHGVVLYQAPVAGFKRFGWQLEDEAQFDALAAALAAHGIASTEVERGECDALGQGRSVRFVDPYVGATWEFYATMRAEPMPFKPTVVEFDRLGHVALRTDRFDDALRFYTEALNFRVSDMIQGQMAFLRSFPNKYHHSFAIAKAARPGLHHVNFMVTSLDEWGRCVVRLPKQNVPVVWGPGRHTNAGTLFDYFLDPDSMTLEYGFGMEEFPETGARAPNIRPPGREAADLWNNDIDPRACGSGVIEAGA
jgi:2,3-dihydroxy-p-cumate/2,3-dihydroxybenzoate 3,4-dioxygenase